MKAISLFSGGLDSQLAVFLIQKQGITVVGVNFVTPFFAATQATRDAAQALGIELLIADISSAYMDTVLKNPVYGYGQHMNPCIDCHAFMLKNARKIMDDTGASFLITGEVLGQRPMSQNRSALNAVDKLSGQKGLIVRPLSGRLMKPTIPEEEGWIDRDQLLDISGRSRKRQMALAEQFGILEYPSPAGGCLLTEGNYSRRLQHWLDIKPETSADECHVLRWGRHFALPNGLLIIGRNYKENQYLLDSAMPDDVILETPDHPGPTAIFKKAGLQEPQLEYIAAIVARYSDGRNQPEVAVRISAPDRRTVRMVLVKPMVPEEVPAPL